MKKLVSVLLALCMLLSFSAAAEEETDLSLIDVKERGALLVGMDAQYAPFCFRNELDELVGYDVDFAYAICDALGVSLQIVPIAWSEKDEALKNGEVDMILCGYAQTDSLENALRYSFPYLETHTALVVKGDSEATNAAALAGKALGVRENSCEVEVLIENTDFYTSLETVYSFPSNYELLNSVETGAIDAALVDQLTAQYRIDAGADLKMIEAPEAVWQLVAAFPLDSVALCEAVNDAMVTLAFNGVFSAITTEWFGSDISILASYIVSLEEHDEE